MLFVQITGLCLNECLLFFFLLKQCTSFHCRLIDWKKKNVTKQITAATRFLAVYFLSSIKLILHCIVCTDTFLCMQYFSCWGGSDPVLSLTHYSHTHKISLKPLVIKSNKATSFHWHWFEEFSGFFFFFWCHFHHSICSV